MVATAAVDLRFERGLRALRAEVDGLPAVAASWEAWSEIERVDYSLEWDHLVADYLPDLDERARGRRLTPDQHARYEEVRRVLQEARPLIDQLGLYPPPALDRPK